MFLSSGCPSVQILSTTANIFRKFKVYRVFIYKKEPPMQVTAYDTGHCFVLLVSSTPTHLD